MIRIKDPLHRLLAVNALAGMVLGGIFAAGLLALDSGKLRTLMMGDAQGGVALFVLVFSFMSMGASLLMGSAVMMAKVPADRPPTGGHREEDGLVRVRSGIRRPE